MRGAIRSLVIFAAALLSGAAAAQPAPLGVLDAYEAARLHDPVFRGAFAEQQAGLEYAELGRARLRPVISAVVAAGLNTARVTNSNGAVDNRGQYNSSSASLQLRQPLYDREAWAARGQGLARTAASEATFRARETDLMLRVFDLYTKVLVAQDEVTLIQAQLRSLQEQLRANEQRFRRGEGTRTDVLETGAKRSVIEARLGETLDAERNARHALEVIVGRPVASLMRLKRTPIAVQPDAESLETWRLRAMDTNGDIESLRHMVEVARRELDRATSGHYPRLDLLLSTGRSVSDTTSTFEQTSRTQTIGVQLSVPIYSGGAISAQARQAAAQLVKAQADLDTKALELQVELHQQHALQRNSASRIEALSVLVQSSQQLVDAMRRSVAGGERTNADVLDAQERMAQAERDLVAARYRQLQAGLRMRSLAGVLQPQDLQAMGTLFEGPP